MSANTWRVDVEFKKETHVIQGHLDPLDGLILLGDTPVASVDIQTLIRAPFSNSGVVATVHLACSQTTETIGLAQEQATALAMEGLRNGWEILQDRILKGHFPGCAAEGAGR